jgi:DNA-binding HxlR family transcriptional regulator
MKKREDLPECPVATTVMLISGKWKLLIIRNLRVRPWRYNELLRSLDGISAKILTESLRSLESDGLIVRTELESQSPKVVEYALSSLGVSMNPILNAMEEFGKQYKELVSKL